MYPIIWNGEEVYKIIRGFHLSSFIKMDKLEEWRIEAWKQFLDATHVMINQQERKVLFLNIIKDAEEIIEQKLIE